MKSTEIALLLNSNKNKITRIGEIISKKIPERDLFNNLNEYEKTIIYIDIFENHTTNGGFEEFFWNSSGKFSHEILEAYEKIGAVNTANIIYTSFTLFGEIPIPKNINLRRELLTVLKKDIWKDLNNEFYKNKDDIPVLILKFVSDNISYFQ